jgi:hypothetical protein
MVVLRPNGKSQERNPRLGDYTNTLDYYTLTAQPEFQFYHTSIPQFAWDFSVCYFFFGFWGVGMIVECGFYYNVLWTRLAFGTW